MPIRGQWAGFCRIFTLINSPSFIGFSHFNFPMKKIVLTALMAMASLAAIPAAQAQTTCPAAPNTVVISGQSITANTTWTNNNIYELRGFNFVESGATLTIQPGTIIKGDKNTKGTLTIKQGARIDARGTATNPIVFTSTQPAGTRARGDWGGLIILGKAPQNIPATATQPLPKIEGGLTPDAFFGGTDANDNSGFLQYVRIEFPGVAFSTDNEINGLTMGGVGAGTTIDHIQVSYSGDDSYEWFGGTVNAKYLIAFRGLDDDWDTDNGFSGKVQFGVSLRDPNVADAAGASNGFESDNDANATNNQPLTRAVFSNMTNIIATPVSGQTLNSKYANGMHIRRNSAESIFNSLSVGYPNAGLLLDASIPLVNGQPNGGSSAYTTEVNATNGSISLEGNVFAGYTAANIGKVVTGSTFNIQQFVSTGNDVTATVASLNFDPSNQTISSSTTIVTPNFQALAGSVLAMGAVFTNTKLDAFFDRVNFRGAVAPAGTTGGVTTNWANAGWTNYNPQITCYNVAGQTLASREIVNASLQSLTVSPNPTQGAATLGFDVKTATTATVRVFDVMGREVAVVLTAGKLGAGPQRLALPANLAPGVYVATVATPEAVQSVRFVVAQ